MFPDAPMLRGKKHLNTLMKLAENGVGAGVLLSVQRPDARKIRPYYEVDPEFAKLLRKATEKGVRIFTQTLAFRPPSTITLKANSPSFSFN